MYSSSLELWFSMICMNLAVSFVNRWVKLACDVSYRLDGYILKTHSSNVSCLAYWPHTCLSSRRTSFAPQPWGPGCMWYFLYFLIIVALHFGVWCIFNLGIFCFVDAHIRLWWSCADFDMFVFISCCLFCEHHVNIWLVGNSLPAKTFIHNIYWWVFSHFLSQRTLGPHWILFHRGWGWGFLLSHPCCSVSYQSASLLF